MERRRSSQVESARLTGCSTATWPSGAERLRTVASASIPPGSVIGITPARSAKTVSAWPGPSTSTRLRSPEAIAGSPAITRPLASLT